MGARSISSARDILHLKSVIAGLIRVERQAFTMEEHSVCAEQLPELLCMRRVDRVVRHMMACLCVVKQGSRRVSCGLICLIAVFGTAAMNYLIAVLVGLWI
jgi:hypothetical protein